MSDVAARLRAALGGGGDQVEQGEDGRPRALPDSTDGVAHVCALANEQGWRVRVEGQGTWMPSDAPADLTLSTRGLARLVDLAPADLVATAEAGLPVAILQRELAGGGAWLALDPPGRPDRSLGSVVATATAGPLQHGCGPVRDHILGTTVVTGDGRVVRSGGNVVKNVAGYDLTKLQVGGFGAFGVLTRLHLRLRAEPAARLTLLACGGRDLLTREARRLTQASVEAAAIELCSPAVGAENEWVLAVALVGTMPGVADETARVRAGTEAEWSELSPTRAEAFWHGAARAALGGPVSLRFGVFADGVDELLDLLQERLDLGLVSAAAAKGGLRWSGTSTLEVLRRLRRTVAEREIPLTLERGPWALRQGLGHFGAYREGAAALVTRLRATFDPSPTFSVALDGADD